VCLKPGAEQKKAGRTSDNTATRNDSTRTRTRTILKNEKKRKRKVENVRCIAS